MWLCWLALLVAIAFGCSFLAPGSGLHASALRAFDSSVSMLSRGDIESTLSDGGDEEDEDNAGRRPVRSVASRQPVAPLKTSAIRRRVTPLMQKRVAVRYNFRCALCHLPLDETWENDHRIPLSQARNAAEAERLNSIDNLQPVHRACHQLKSSREAASR